MSEYSYRTEDESEFRVRMDGPRFHSAIIQIVTDFRNNAKYPAANDTEAEITWDDAYVFLAKRLSEIGIDPYDY